MKNFASPHCHIQSLDSASTPEAFIKREKELETGAITTTDHGSLQACRHVYDLAKKAKLTPILGLEAYFRDDDCPLIKAAGLDPKTYLKYFHITLHAMDEVAYYALVKVLSRAALTRVEKHGSEYKPLFDWEDLEELANYNITFTTGCLVGMVQRHYLAGRPDLAEAYYLKLKEMVKPGNLYVEVFPHKTDKNFVSGIFVTFDDGTKQKWYAGKKLKVNGEEVTAEDLAKTWKSDSTGTLQGVKNRNTWEECNKTISKVEKIEEFIENECIPDATDSDSQKWTNWRMIALAEKHGEPVLISDDAHFATPDEKVVQDVRLRANGDSWRFYASYHRHTSEEAWEYFRKEMAVDLSVFEGWIDNNVKWSERFKDFKFNDTRELPTRFYPEDTLLHTKRLIDAKGRMDWNNTEYVERLKAEINMLHFNGTIDLLPYFFIDEEVCSLYESKGMLTGPGRGSAAGLLLSYLLGITHVDPLKYQLSMERFLTLDRIKNGKWPDIDQDLPTRHLLVDDDDPDKGWLRERFGDNVAQISTDTQLKLRSAIKDVARATMGEVPAAINKLAHQIQAAPQGVEDKDFVFGYEGPGGWVEGTIETDSSLQEYIDTYPKQWELVQKLLGLVRQKGRHACLLGGDLILTTEGYLPIVECNGKTVLTGQGAEAPAVLLEQGIQEVFEFTSDNGHTIKCTADHLVLTEEDGWTPILKAMEENLTVKSFH